MMNFKKAISLCFAVCSVVVAIANNGTEKSEKPKQINLEGTKLAVASISINFNSNSACDFGFGICNPATDINLELASKETVAIAIDSEKNTQATPASAKFTSTGNLVIFFKKSDLPASTLNNLSTGTFMVGNNWTLPQSVLTMLGRTAPFTMQAGTYSFTDLGETIKVTFFN